MEKIEKYWLVLFIFLIAFVLFFLKGILLLDPDFGWHIRMGQLILQSGIPASDPFSYTMPSFPFIDHEWLTNVVLAYLYGYIGMVGLSLIYSFLALATLLITLKGRFIKWAYIPFVLSIAIFYSFVGVRPQVESWFLFAILIALRFSKNAWVRIRFFIPLLFIVWVNLHGGFAYGIVTLLVIAFLETIKKRKIAWSEFAVSILCFIATWVNPYGPRIWEEIYLQFTDPLLRWTIQEWAPAFFVPDLAFWVFVPVSLVFLLRYFKKMPFVRGGLAVLFSVASLSSARHIPLFIIVILPLAVESFELFEKEAKSVPGALKRLRKAHMIFFIFIACAAMISLTATIRSAGKLNEEDFYPLNAVQFLKKQQPGGNLWTGYNWGGYLIWKYPEKKVYIDGRMPSWRWSKKIPGESPYAFKDYLSMIHNKSVFQREVKKYQITTILIPLPQKTKEPEYEKWVKAFLNRLGRKDHRLDDLYGIMKQSGFRRVYKDSVAAVYQK